MRLGDLDDLKAHISELLLVYSLTDHSDEELDNAILNAIDNAPPVPDRPKGEWVKVKEEIMSVDTVAIYKCSKCERVIATFPSKLAKYYPFCHCGADMRKGGTE